MNFARLAVPVLISSVLFAGTASARTLYVAKSGNDANLGTLVTAPLATIKKAAAVALPGDVVNVRGGVYTGTLSIMSKGTAAARITFQSYPGETAVIDGTGTAPNTDLLTVYQAQYVDLKGFEVRNSTRLGICVYDSKNIGIYDNNIHHSVRNGIYIGAGSMGISSDMVVDGNVLHENVTENQYFAFSGGGWAQSLGVYKTDRARITNNRSYQNWGEGIGTGLGNDVLIENNTVSDNFSVGIYLDNARTTTVNRNLVYTTGDTRFYREGHPASGIAVANEAYSVSLPSRGNVFTNNIVVNSKYGFYYGAYQNGGGMVDTKVVNNTFHKATAAMIWIDEDVHSNSVVANNIFSQAGGQMALVGGAGVTYTSNLWYGGIAGKAAGSGDVIGDPLFVKAGGFTPADYKLKTLSPAIHTASAHLTANDYFGAERTPSGDIGAHELSLVLGSSAPSSSVLTAASNLQANDVQSGTVQLTWIASEGDVAGYKVYRNNAYVATVTGTTWTDSGLSASTTYNYEVIAFDTNGNPAPGSNVLTVSTQSVIDKENPTAPSALRVTGITGSSISLVWARSTDNVAIRGYAVYRDGILLETIAAVTGYTATGLEANRTYTFHVVAIDAERNQSSVSNTITATTTMTTKRRSAR
ncbi:MAG TPA: right-handed parallel beta-helix repeat-containing protein [Thermoanaerobaculia bacterium]|nr:right-handed parallel beta-helix repeat-containing protein [Thermoanaerobaculia bacterium]